MRWMGIKEFRETFHTPGSRPALSTLRANIEKIPGGRKVGNRYMVDIDVYEREFQILPDLHAVQGQLQKDSDLQGLL